MFLSKLFSIFKSKKDNQNVPSDSTTGGPVVSPTAVGGAVGLEQPSQPAEPAEPSTQTEAPSPAPEVAQADTPASTAPSFGMPPNDDKPAQEDNTLPGQPADQQIPGDGQKQPGDDIQDTTIGGDDNDGLGTDSPLGQSPAETPTPSDDQDTGVVTPPASDDNNQIPTV